jgi:hypothetical protein
MPRLSARAEIAKTAIAGKTGSMENKPDLGALALDYADAEFNGRSFNGKSFMATLRSLDAAAAAGTATWEGYCAWETLIHVAYCKYLIATELEEVLPPGKRTGRIGELEPYPWAKTLEVFAPPPAETSPAAWSRDLDYLERVHEVCMAVIRRATPAELGSTMPSWGIPFGQALAWFLSHDAYHAAQLRNMGVPGLKDRKIGT